MIFVKHRMKWVGILLSMAIAFSFCACGEVEKYTAEATKCIRDLDYPGALELLKLAEEAGENQRVVERSKGLAFMGLTEYEKAIEAFQKSLLYSNGILQDFDYDVKLYLAAAYTKAGRYEEAEDAYQAILDLKPDEKDAYFLRGNVRMYLDKFEEAKADFDRVVAKEPKNYDRIIHIYEILDSFGYREAGKAYLQAVLDSGAKIENSIIGRIYYYLGEYQKACMALEEAKSKGDVRSFLYLGKSYEATGDFNYAASVYSNYLAKYEGNAEIYNQLGLCEMAKGEYQRALEAFQAGMQLNDSSMQQNLSFNEIIAYEYLGDFKQAHILMNNYCKNYPDDERAKREATFLSTR